MGIAEILTEWIAFRTECVKRKVYFELQKKKEKLHLLKGLQKILLDIDKAIRIVRETEEEIEVIPNLMIGFGIDEIQAEYVAEIKLRHLNKEYILSRISEIEQLEKDVIEMQDILGSDRKLKKIIIDELNDVSKKYGEPRKTTFYFAGEDEDEEEGEDVPNYPVNLFLSMSGYFKKITPQSLRMSGEQKLKDGDEMDISLEADNHTEMIFFSDKAQAYKTKASAFEDTKASVLGSYIPSVLGFDEDESVVTMITTKDYSGYLLFIFKNGKVAKVPLNAYETKTNRKKLANAYSDKSKLIKILLVNDNTDIVLRSSNGRALMFNSGMILPKSTRNTIGVQVMTLKAKALVSNAFIVSDDIADSVKKFKTKTIPAVGSLAKDFEDPDQLSL